MSVPLTKCWTAETARQYPALVSPLGSEVLEAIPDMTLIALHILVTMGEGAAARDDVRRAHANELSTMQVDSLLDWSDDDLSLLTGSKWGMVASSCRQDIEEEYEELAEVIGEFLNAYAIDSKAFLWAKKICMSRCMQFIMDDGTTFDVLCPGIDMFNHSVHVPMRSDGFCLRTSNVSAEQMLVACATTNLSVGEEAFVLYSPVSNGRLLLMSGFVVVNNPFDAVELTLTFPVNETSMPVYLSLAECLDAGVWAPNPGSAVMELTKAEFVEMLPPDDPQPTEIVLHIRLPRDVQRAQLERVLAFVRLEQLCRDGAALTPETLADCDHDIKNRVSALTKLQSLLTTMLRGFANSVEEDETVPTDVLQGSNGHKEQALQVLKSEKRIFGDALRLVGKMLEEIER